MQPLANWWLAPIAPLLRHQGRVVRRRMPEIPEARGPGEGRFPGDEPGLRIVAVGESTIAGVGVERMEQSLTAHLAKELAARTGRAAHWHAFGASGATVEDNDAQLARIEAQRATLERADLALVVMGVSDTLALTGPRRFFAKMDCLILRLRLLLWPLPVLVTGVPRLDRFAAPLPPPLSTVLGRRSKSLDKALLKVASEGYRITYMPSRVPDTAANIPRAYAADGFHPGAEGYRLWAAYLAPAAMAMLDNERHTADFREVSALQQLRGSRS